MSWRLLARRALWRLGRAGPRFATRDVRIGRRVHFGPNVVFNCRRVRIGDGVVFHGDTRIDAEVFEIGDHATIYPRCFFPGPGEVRIGHNFWLGPGAIVDAMGGATIGNNVCVAAGSQLWTHMMFGDLMLGCRFHSVKPLVIEDDAWLGPHCLVAPVHVGARSLAMLGSLITRDMAPDRTYAGAPAADVTDRFGPQFRETTPAERAAHLERRLAEFAARHPRWRVAGHLRIATEPGDYAAPLDVTVFNVAERRYTKRGTLLEHALMRFLLPGAKFVPA